MFAFSRYVRETYHNTSDTGQLLGGEYQVSVSVKRGVREKVDVVGKEARYGRDAERGVLFGWIGR